MKVSENTSVAMPIKNMIGIIVGVAMGIFAYTEITARLTSLETSRELMTADLLKKSEQVTTDKEQFLLLEELYKIVEKHQELLDKNIHNQVMLEHVEKQLDKALADIEKLKDKVRENGKNYKTNN
jgi:L-cysteine desulfidase